MTDTNPSPVEAVLADALSAAGVEAEAGDTRDLGAVDVERPGRIARVDLPDAGAAGSDVEGGQ